MSTPLERIHHVNFLFKDLELAVERFETTLGIGPFEYESLPDRGVRTARAAIGESWIVLVSPTADEGVPAAHLREHGEGFFLLSFGVDDLGRAIDELSAAGRVAVGATRDGIAGWRVADLPLDATLGVPVQIADDGDR